VHIYEINSIIIYFCSLLLIGILSYRRNLTSTDFIIGDRSLNYWLTALAAHASDMSSWLFMGYPALIFTQGLFGTWVALGLIICMFLNWHYIAPRFRRATEELKAMTFSSFFESRLRDESGKIRLFTACILIFFYTIYISSGLIGLGFLLENLFNIPYTIGILIGLAIIVPYVFIGGYLTLAWLDLFQGIFLMGVILFVPLYLLPKIGGLDSVIEAMRIKNISFSLLPDFSLRSWVEVFFISFSWGLGYFGQPHILTKFMGIRHVEQISKSKYIGMTWMILSLSAATLVGLTAISFFSGNISNPEQIFICMVRQLFHPFVSGLMLCAILAATINAMSSQVLVLSSSLAEDLYKKFFPQKASGTRLLVVSRLGVIVVALTALIIAWSKWSSIFSLVLYAWSGIGASFGPLIIFSLYSRKINKEGAWAGILIGGITAAIWPYFNQFLSFPIPAMIMGYFLGILGILIGSRCFRNKSPVDLQN
jgi:sodium/proline symporter